MQVTFKDSTPPKDVPYLFYMLRKKLADVQGQLPAGLLGPVVNDEFSDVDSILYMMTGDGADYAQLKKAAEGMRQRLLKVPGVTKVDLYGTQDEKIYVEFSHAKLATLGITPQALFDSLAKQNNVVPAGTVETSVAARAAARHRRARRRQGGRGNAGRKQWPGVSPGRYRHRHPWLRRSAELHGASGGQAGARHRRGHRQGRATSWSSARRSQKATAEFMEAVPQGINVEQIADQPKVVEHAVGEFVHSFIEALAIVLFVCFLALGLAHRHRGGAVGAAGAGDRLHRHECDVARPASHHARRADHRARAAGRRRHHRGRDDGGEDGAGLGPHARGVLCLGIHRVPDADRHAGHGGRLPADRLCQFGGRRICRRHFLDRGDRAGRVLVRRGDLHALYRRQAAAEHHRHATTTIRTRSTRRRVYRMLRSMIQWCVDHRIKVVVATVGVFALSIVGFGHVQQQFFPLSERPELFLQLRLPEGTAFNVTEKSVKKAEALLKDDKDISTYTAYVGQGSPRFWLGLNPQLPNEAFAEIVIVAKDVEARERIKARLEKAVADGALTEARVRVDRFNFGPPVGFPVQFRVIGPDTKTVREIAYQVRDVVRAEPERQGSAARLERAVALPEARGRSGPRPRAWPDAAGRLAGAEHADLRRAGDDHPRRHREGRRRRARGAVRAARSRPCRRSHGHLAQRRRGAAARRSQKSNTPMRSRSCGGATATWRSRCAATSSTACRRLTSPTRSGRSCRRSATACQPAYRIEAGGAFEESAKGNASIFVLFPLMVIVMLTLLMIQLQSFSRLFLVFLTAPLGIIGASLGLNVANQPFGFVALLGLIALAGMIMRNAVILVDQIETDVAQGLTRKEAIVEATVRRARPVVLTALAAILAMIPLSRSAFWGPMAITIMGGLFVATFLTLLYLPGLYALWFRKSLEESGTSEHLELAPHHPDQPQPAFPLAEAAE